MILGASLLQLPAILKAKELGYTVISVDMDPHAIGFKHADIIEQISTIDIEGVISTAEKHQIDAIMTLATDYPVRTVAAVAKKFNLIGISEQSALWATDKGQMRDRLSKCNIPIPKYYCVNQLAEYYNAIKSFSHEFIVKPTDNSGSRGIYHVHNRDDVDHAFFHAKAYSRSGEVLVEEFMKGREVSVEGISINGEVNVIAITDKITTGIPNFVEIGHTQPTDLEPKIVQQIKDVAIAAIKALEIDNGGSHTEMIITTEGPKIVELGARLGGDCITSHLVPLSTGINIIGCCIEIALGKRPDITPQFSKGSAIRYLQSKGNQIHAITGVENAMALEGIQEISFTRKIGDQINKIQNSNDRIGFVVAQKENRETVISLCDEAIKLIEIS